jgi:hypothetical protein
LLNKKRRLNLETNYFYYLCEKSQRKDMKNISVQISDVEYNTFGFSKDRLSFSEFAGIIEQQIARQALRRSVMLAEQHGLSAMSMDEINAEVNAVRQCKK